MLVRLQLSSVPSQPESTVSYTFLFKATATTEIYTLSLHDALPILLQRIAIRVAVPGVQVPSVVTAIDVTLERRRRMDGAHDRASGRVHAPAGMYGPGLDAHGMTLPVW